MSDSCQARSEEQQVYMPGMAVPAARPINDFSMDRVGNDVVLFDVELLQYHSLNDLAYRVWRLCDGQNSVELIAAQLERSGAGAHIEAVELAVAQLVDAGLMQAPVQSVDVRLQRRKVLKMAAAGVIAAVGLPVVSSITAPHAAAQNTATCGFLPGGFVGCGNTGQDTCCCPTSPPNVGNCRNPNGCSVACIVG